MSAILRSRLPAIIAVLPVGVDGATREAAEVVVERAKARVSVNEGDLRDAIHIEREGVAEYAVVAGDENEVFYGHMVEHGTSHSAPRPFLVPSLDETEDLAVRLVALTLKRL